MNQNNKLEEIRHSLAHLLAAAVLELYPETKPTIGPAIENGFYYDFDFGDVKISEEDLPKIEKKMKEILPNWEGFEKQVVTAKVAKDKYKDNPYKTELIDELEKEDSKISLYTSGDFTDLCRGGHVDKPNKEIVADAFKLSSLAGAYWRGDEKNKMLTRIYGLAFESKKELEEYEKRMKEAKERDHRKLGKELDLFMFSELVGPGLPLWTPKGTLLRDLLDSFVWELRKKRGYEKVEIPHITKKDLYETSGHWDKFGDELFKAGTREGHQFVIKPMNCPHHTQIFDRKMHSYKEMPQRYANTTMVYRDEQTGELSGLTRVRSITQDDAHVFARFSQVKEEAIKIWDIVEEFYGAFDIKTKATLSIHDPENMDKYLGTEEVWNSAIAQFEEVIKEKGEEVEKVVGEAAFYGPKIDFIGKDSLGREWQVATIQLDMNMPERFALTCVNEKGEKERITMLHAAIMGSIERFMALMLEHLGGKFPLWLSPVQVKILPIAEAHQNFAKEIGEKLKNEGIRDEIDDSSEKLGKKIRNTKLEKIPYYMVIGDNEMSSGILKIEDREENAEEMSIEKLIEKLREEVGSRK